MTMPVSQGYAASASELWRNAIGSFARAVVRASVAVSSTLSPQMFAVGATVADPPLGLSTGIERSVIVTSVTARGESWKKNHSDRYELSS